MEATNIFQLSPEQEKSARDNLLQLEKIVKNKVSLIDSGVFTKEQIAQIEETYNMNKKMLDTFAKKQ